MSYCQTFRDLNSKYPVTTVIIPPDQVRRMEIRTMQLIIQCGGQPLGVGFGNEDGSLAFQAIFFNDEGRQKFCDTVDKEIDAGRPIIVNPVRSEDGKEDFELKFNIKFMLAKFHFIMNELQPLLTYIEENGGWPVEDGKFPAGDALDKEIYNETLSPEVLKAVSTFGTFMGAYLVGSASICTGSTIITSRDITP